MANEAQTKFQKEFLNLSIDKFQAIIFEIDKLRSQVNVNSTDNKSNLDKLKNELWVTEKVIDEANNMLQSEGDKHRKDIFKKSIQVFEKDKLDLQNEIKNELELIK